MSNILVIYHGNCDDGFGAAYAAWKKFGDQAEYFPGIYGEDAPDVTGKIVYMLDFSYKREVLERMSEQAADIVILDHHKSAKEDLEPLIQNGTVKGQFDMTRSGAMMAWVYFHPGQYIPRLIAYIQDRDLWQHRLKSSREVSIALRSYPKEFDVWSDLMADRRTGELMEEGRHVLRAHDMTVQSIASNHYLVDFGGCEVLIANCPWAFASDVGAELAKDRPYSITFTRETDVVRVSLRSSGDYDVSELALAYGGGGHANAAGFTLSASKPCPWFAGAKHGW